MSKLLILYEFHVQNSFTIIYQNIISFEPMNQDYIP